MASPADTSPGVLKRIGQWNGHRVRGVLILLLGCLAIVAPFFAGPEAIFLGGLLLVVCGVLEMLETFQAPDDSRLRSTYLSGWLSILAGILLLNMPELLLRGVALVLAGTFLLDGVNKGIASLRALIDGKAWAGLLATGLVNVGLGLMLATRWPVSDWPVVGIVVGVRMLASGWSILLGRKPPPRAAETPADLHPDVRLRLPPHPTFASLNGSLQTEEDARRAIDATWCWIFVLLFFAIHVGRMRVYWNLVGMIAPLVAVVGDLGVALLLSFGLILPARLLWRRLTRPLERRGWERTLARVDQGRSPGLLGRLSRVWLTGRLRFARRLRQMRYSPRAALRWGLRVGLPLTAVFIAIQPIFGFSWFFNSENWASIVWDHWAAVHTDTWRENMIGALREHYHDRGIPEERLFRVEPAGITGSDDFSFLVLGDTGEGGGAQHSLRDQYLLLGNRPDVKFLVVSSDVIYPDGAMRDYEPNFYLPFKGFKKPIYAIPGNHDWYDALEGFAANFLEADAARTCMLSRVITDHRLTTTTEARIERYIQEAARLRREFGVSTGWQRGPFFEVQTERFALVAVDTGVLKTVDSAQWDWFKAALARSRGKFTLVILGHPLYTGGRYQGDPDQLTGEWSPGYSSPLVPGGESAPFTAIHRLLREYQVDVVMAGDMHFFEHYQEPYKAGEKTRTMHHFVNGGGGAYICVGLPFDWPRKPDLPLWTAFPRKDAIITKLDAQTPTWKMPLWLWVKHLSAWPFTGYIMSAAFDHNQAPFFQSFVEVQVQNSKGEVRFLPYAANGRLRWRDLENFGAFLPAGKTEDDPVEFIIKMSPGRAAGGP
jgi:uncharacterized membrane protein HdeD (DUF308 family)